MREKVTVIIPTMNRLETLKVTLDSYTQGTIIPDQIVIVDQTQDETLRAVSYTHLTLPTKA